jgi:hypothetical protein
MCVSRQVLSSAVKLCTRCSHFYRSSSVNMGDAGEPMCNQGLFPEVWAVGGALSNGLDNCGS